MIYPRVGPQQIFKHLFISAYLKYSKSLQIGQNFLFGGLEVTMFNTSGCSGTSHISENDCLLKYIYTYIVVAESSNYQRN